MRWFVALVALLTANFSVAQQVTHLIVPFGAGGVQDIVARSINAELGAALGRNVIVENRAGAGGTIAAAAVAKAPPDGQTLILSAASHTIAGRLYARLPYDPIRDFTPIAHLGNVDYVLLISSTVPAHSVAEFVAYAKANPGKLNYASAGNGSATHLAMAYFAALAGIDLVHIPYKSTGEAVQEVLAGRSQAVIAANVGAIPYLKDPRVHALGMSGTQRSRFIPDLPTIAEAAPDGSQLRGYSFDSWMGLLGPAGMSREVVDTINNAVTHLLHDPVILDRLAKQGIVAQAMSPDGFASLLRADYDKAALVVRLSGARID